MPTKLASFSRLKVYVRYVSLFNFQTNNKFWDAWKQFEIKYGNEDTVREMLRIKRSVQATYNTQVRMTTSVLSTWSWTYVLLHN